jgi:hypothetical protein
MTTADAVIRQHRTADASVTVLAGGADLLADAEIASLHPAVIARLEGTVGGRLDRSCVEHQVLTGRG